MPDITNIVFDLGGVLIDWNPRYLYRKIWPDNEPRMEYFLQNICTGSWNVQMDAGRPMAQAIAELQQSSQPEWHEAISLWQNRWPEMLGPEISGTANLLRALRRQNKYRLLALTNWSAETFPYALERYSFLRDCFEGIVVSGEILMAKPERQIYDHLLTRFGLSAASTLFIDDSAVNAEGARSSGMSAVRFINSGQLISELQTLGIDVPVP